MACSTSRSSFRVSGASISWGRRNKTCISIDAAVLTGGEHFLVSSTTVDYYVWYNTGADADPSIAGRTGIEVDVSGGVGNANVAAQTITAMEAVAVSSVQEFFVASSDSDTCVCIEVNEVGAPLTASADGDTGWTVETQVEGIGGDLGQSSGGVEISMAVTTLDINTDQGGTAKQDTIIQGVEATVSMSLAEMTPEKWELVVGQYVGDDYTPAGGTKVIGLGESRNFSSSFELGGVLTLHPLDRDAADRSEDITLHLTSPIPSSYNFSGEEVSLMDVEFSALPRRDYDSKVSIFTYGDGKQDFR